MCARLVVAHEEQTFLLPLAAALRSAGHEVVAFENPNAAWDAITARKSVEILISGLHFPADGPSGDVLAKQACIHHPGIRVIFIASPDMRKYADKLTMFLATPVSIAGVIATVAGLSTPCLAAEAVTFRSRSVQGTRVSAFSAPSPSTARPDEPKATVAMSWALEGPWLVANDRDPPQTAVG